MQSLKFYVYRYHVLQKLSRGSKPKVTCSASVHKAQELASQPKETFIVHACVGASLEWNSYSLLVFSLDVCCMAVTSWR
jgi:hypothetical protein